MIRISNVVRIEGTLDSAKYRVHTINGESYDINLRVCVGGTPALAFSDYKGGIKRFAVSRRESEINTCRSTRPNGFNILPGGLADVEAFIEEYLPKRTEQAVREDRALQVRRLGNRSSDDWPPRTTEAEPRHVYDSLAACTPEGTWVVLSGRDLHAAMKGLKSSDAVLVDGCIVGVKGLRAYAKVMSKDRMRLWHGEGYIRLTTDNHNTTIKNGAWDKYGGMNGYTAALEFGAQA